MKPPDFMSRHTKVTMTRTDSPEPLLVPPTSHSLRKSICNRMNQPDRRGIEFARHGISIYLSAVSGKTGVPSAHTLIAPAASPVPSSLIKRVAASGSSIAQSLHLLIESFPVQPLPQMENTDDPQMDMITRAVRTAAWRTRPSLRCKGMRQAGASSVSLL